MSRSVLAILLLLAFAFAPACGGGSRSEPEPSGFLMDYSRLAPSERGTGVLVWVDPDVDWSVYSKIMFDPVVIALTPEAEQRDLDPEDLRHHARKLQRKFENGVADRYAIVEVPGPGVLRIRLALTDVRGRKLGDSGGASMEVEMRDAPTDRVLAAAMDRFDRSRASAGKRVSTEGSWDVAISWWAGRLDEFLRDVSGR